MEAHPTLGGPPGDVVHHPEAWKTRTLPSSMTTGRETVTNRLGWVRYSTVVGWRGATLKVRSSRSKKSLPEARVLGRSVGGQAHSITEGDYTRALVLRPEGLYLKARKALLGYLREPFRLAQGQFFQSRLKGRGRKGL